MLPEYAAFLLHSEFAPYFGVACLAAMLLLSLVPWARPLSWRVVRVIDGDTIVVRRLGRKKTVRLLGIDTPESVHPHKRVEFYSREASAFLRSLLEGSFVRLAFDRGRIRRDLYGRTLAYVYRLPDQLDISAHLLRKGYAKVYHKEKCGRQDELLAIEHGARRDYRGVWTPLWLRPARWLLSIVLRPAYRLATVFHGAAPVLLASLLMAVCVSGVVWLHHPELVEPIAQRSLGIASRVAGAEAWQTAFTHAQSLWTSVVIRFTDGLDTLIYRG